MATIISFEDILHAKTARMAAVEVFMVKGY